MRHVWPCRQEYPRVPRYLLWIMTEVAIIGSDIQEVIGSAIAILLLTRGLIPLWAGVLITAFDSFIILLVERLGVRHLEAVFGVLIGLMAGAFGLMAALADVPPLEVLEGMDAASFCLLMEAMHPCTWSSLQSSR